MIANQSQIKQIMEKLLSVMDFEAVVEIDDQQDFLRINIQSSQAAYLIGRSGETLKALQQVGRAAINKQLGETVKIVIDVNDYQQSRLEALKNAAFSAAKEVVQNKETKRLPPMDAYERRIIHLALANWPGVKTESEGDGEQRRIVIKSVNN